MFKTLLADRPFIEEKYHKKSEPYNSYLRFDYVGWEPQNGTGLTDEQMLKRCKNEGLNTAVDTCGNVPFENFKRVLPYTDTFLFDIKAIDDEVHKKCTGASNKRILDNLSELDRRGASIEIRVPFVHNFNAGEMEKIARFAKKLSNCKRVRVLPYHNYAVGKYEALQIKNTLPDVLPTQKETEEAQNLFTIINQFSVL